VSTHIQRQLGKALAEKLSQYNWPVPLFPKIAVEYRRDPDFDREDTEQLRVSVSPGSMNWNAQTGMQIGEM
jgi:hypothetical protein